MACSTLVRTSAETYRSPFTTRDTVFPLTPARAATSRIVVTGTSVPGRGSICHR
ncbi:hypothetical protein GCM10011594_17220 [Nakamurella endophytica]|uniref:Uncharacterized protein n=1 Tax=Nakamurella endophytica TaxID=1748367 RepID=A0A917ST96_9ACTN|nr:hypothetical protein GCM10011594_17220 [Nakamurella endophytica]